MSKVLILGAGSSFGHGAAGDDRPPLVNGFFNSQIPVSLKEQYSILLNYLTEVAGKNLFENTEISIEEMFAQMEPLWKLGLLKDITYDGTLDKIVKQANKPFNEFFEAVSPLDMLRSYVIDVIYLSTKWLQNEECPHHKKLVSKWISAGDTIISFNYDLIVDTSLAINTSWNESIGYGWKAKGKEKDNKFGIFYRDKYSADNEYIMESTDPEIKLLKPHGSLNFWRQKRPREKTRYANTNILWAKEDKDKKYEYEEFESIAVSKVGNIWKEITPGFWVNYEAQFKKYNAEVKEFLRILLYARGKEDLYDKGLNFPVFIMPTPYKSFYDMAYGEMTIVWRHIYRSLELANEVVSCGFSFADHHFNQILFHATRKRKNKLPIKIVTNSERSFIDIQGKLVNCNIELMPFVNGFGRYVNSL